MLSPIRRKTPLTIGLLLTGVAVIANHAHADDASAKLAPEVVAAADKAETAELEAEVAECDARLAMPAVNDNSAARAAALDRRGNAHLQLGHIAEALADFDEAIKLEPRRGPGHWQRGIACYYAGQFDAGAKQFEAYQTVDSADVENVTWRYLCVARQDGVEKARETLLEVGADPRIPMHEVYELFAGRATPDKVLASARAGNPTDSELRKRLFYAQLYLGLWHEAAGRAKESLAHIRRAAVDYALPGYMHAVARVHVALRSKEPAKS
ncbi:MAG: tetratricopeptide repeat protein [Pirellulales bacterium]|nr:tetratricopeptide repeat protein [Pirellulales bacterium]